MAHPDLTVLIGGDGHERCPKTGKRLDLLATWQAAALELAVEAALSAVYFGDRPEEVLREVQSALGIAGIVSYRNFPIVAQSGTVKKTQVRGVQCSL